jgi:hypothetical protein
VNFPFLPRSFRAISIFYLWRFLIIGIFYPLIGKNDAAVFEIVLGAISLHEF